MCRAILAVMLLSCAAVGQWTSITIDTSNSPLEQQSIVDLRSDGQNRVYILTGSSLWAYHQTQYTHISVLAPDTVDRVTAILVEDDGTIWLGTYSMGLYRVRGDTLASFGPASTCVSCSYVLPIGIDPSGQPVLTIGEYGGIAMSHCKTVRFDGNACTEISDMIPIGSEAALYSYARTTDGVEWFSRRTISDVGTCDGLYTLESGLMQEVSSGGCPRVVHTAGDTALIGGIPGGGLVRMVAGHPLDTLLSVAGTISLGSVSLAYGAPSGALWVLSGEAGLVRMDARDTLVVDADRSTDATAIAGDDQGRIWVGTRLEGIHVYQNTQSVRPHSTVRAAVYRRNLDHSPGLDISGRTVKTGPQAATPTIQEGAVHVSP